MVTKGVGQVGIFANINANWAKVLPQPPSQLDYWPKRLYMSAMSNNSHSLPSRFLKMHGAGNDFVVLDARTTPLALSPEVVQAIGDRHRGVGFDQLALIEPHTDADAKITFYNGDGSVSGACGNATRCVADLIIQETNQDQAVLRTDFGELRAVRFGELISVNMGAPKLNWDEIPLSQEVDTCALPIDGNPGAVSMGNPHMVFAIEDAEAVDVAGIGAIMEHHGLFPQATNVEFCQVLAPDHIRMRVWERGTGITLACGSGACAAVVALHRQERLDRKVHVDVDGGRLSIDWRDDGVWMTGPTAKVFEGQFDPSLFATSP